MQRFPSLAFALLVVALLLLALPAEARGVTLPAPAWQWRASSPLARCSPAAGLMPRSARGQPPAGRDQFLFLVASGLAVTFLAAIAVIVAAVVVILRRQRRGEEDDSGPPQPPG